MTTGLASPWSLAFLPDGKMLVSEMKGTLRLVTKEGVHSAVEGVPPVKTVAAQGFHDIVLDPDFAHNRLIYFSYFAPPPGEAAGFWPNEFAYDRVFNVSVAERRRMRLGMEQVARARLSEDESRHGERRGDPAGCRATSRVCPRWDAVSRPARIASASTTAT